MINRITSRPVSSIVSGILKVRQKPKFKAWLSTTNGRLITDSNGRIIAAGR